MRKRTTNVETEMRIKIAHKLSLILCAYIDPYTIEMYVARGYWTHIHQDCMAFHGRFPRPDMPTLFYTYGSWESLSYLNARLFSVDDCRNEYRALNDFEIHYTKRNKSPK